MKHYRLFSALLLVFSLVALPAADAEASRSQARLSADLAEKLAQGVHEDEQVIVQGDPGRIRRLAARHGLRVTRLLATGGVLEVPAGQLEALSRDPEAGFVSADALVFSTMAVTRESTGADQLLAGFEGLPAFTGLGIGVAVIDSGIAPHQDLHGRVVARVDFTGGSGHDEFGHGTHVAGIIGGDTGMAPGAHIINLRVLGADGSGYMSDVIDAIDWAIANRDAWGIRVINLSLGRPTLDSYLDDPMCLAVERAVAAGLIVVASAGNLGETEDGTPIIGAIVSPGNSPSAVTVGALDARETAVRSDDVVTPYSSRGPTPVDALIKPDLVAPGHRIVSLEAPGSYLFLMTSPSRRVSGEVRQTGPARAAAVRGAGGGAVGATGYFRLSGTSMAAGVVSGAAALLLEARPDLSPAAAKVLLQLSASLVPDAGLLEMGAGSVNAALAVAMAAYGPEALLTMWIAGEEVIPAGMAFGTPDGATPASTEAMFRSIVWTNFRSIVWTNFRSIVWTNFHSIVWTNFNSIVWTNSIVWVNSIVWTNAIVWTNSIVWTNGSLRPDSIVWTNSAASD